MIILSARDRDLGGFSVRRMFPQVERRSVGPFVFFDHMGPADLAPGKGMNVRPHPHINLATVTYLFDGAFQHRDSLGSNQKIEPGAINWMTAGQGIVHSERTPAEYIQSGGRLHGIQLWVGLPAEKEECAPSFSHHPKDTLPEFEMGGVKLKLLLGKKWDYQSPVPVLSEMFYIEARFQKNQSLTLPVQNQEAAIFVVSGRMESGGQIIGARSMGVVESQNEWTITAQEDSHVMLLGGVHLGPRYLDWNFVSSSKERLLEARQDWAMGPSEDGTRFKPIPEDDKEYIPLP